MSFISDLADLTNMPGSAESLRRAIMLNDWSNPFSSNKNSFDQFAGGFSADDPNARMVGRAVGSYFAGQGASDVLGGGGGTAADAGSTPADTVPIEGDAASTAGMDVTDVPLANVGSAPGAVPAPDVVPGSGPAAAPSTAATATPTTTQASAQNLLNGTSPNATPAQDLINGVNGP